MSKELKPATTISEQIETLRERGMQVDEQLAWQWLSNVSYYRLSAYWYPARRLDDDGTHLDEFDEGISFADVVALYEADRKLRTLLFDAIVVMSHLLRVTSPGTTWPDKVSRLLVEEFLQNPLVRTPGLGIPEEWNRAF